MGPRRGIYRETCSEGGRRRVYERGRGRGCVYVCMCVCVGVCGRSVLEGETQLKDGHDCMLSTAHNSRGYSDIRGCSSKDIALFIFTFDLFL